MSRDLPADPLVLLVPPLGDELRAETAATHAVVDLPASGVPGLSPADLERIVAIVCTNGSPVPADLVRALPRLGLVANHGVGYDNVDLDACRAHGVAVTNTPGVLDAAVAETAVGLLLATVRRLPAADRFVRDGAWLDGAFPLTRQVAGSRVGIVGLGRIGGAIARVLTALDCEIVYHNRHEVPGAPYTYHPRLLDLAAAVDVLVVVVPGGAPTAGLVDAAVLDALGPDGALINVARGSVVDESALIAALREGRLGAAGLDVYADEPHVPAGLLDDAVAERVVLLPHIGSATRPTRAAMRRLTLDNLAAWLEGRPLLTPVPELPSDPLDR